MSAISLRSLDDLDQFLHDHDSASVIVVRHDVADDIEPSLTNLARRAATANQPVRLLACDPLAAERWQTAFAAEGLPENNVLPLLDLALAAISGAGSSFPRDARLIDGNEMDVLMEDLKVSGLKPRRLRELTKFLFKGIADGVADDPAWLISAEEQRIFSLLIENLDARRALLPVEAYALGRKALQAPGGYEALKLHVPDNTLVIIPDFSTLSASAQQFAQALGAKTLVACGATVDVSNAEENYPNPAGIIDIAQSENAVLAELTPLGKSADTETIVAAHPAEEFDSVAAVVNDAIGEGIEPGDITIAAPNRIWMDAIAKRLSELNISCIVDDIVRKTKGDPRDETRCGRLRTRTAAKLLANPNDFTAWRSWLGLGDWLVRSDAFLELLAWAQDHKTDAFTAFRALIALPDSARDCQAFSKFDKPFQTFEALKEALATATGYEACALLENAGCTLSESEREALIESGEFDAGAFAAVVLEKATNRPTHAVTIVPYRRAFGRHGKLTIVCGLVNGFLPALDAVSDGETVDHRRRAYDRDRLLFEAVKSTASDRIVFTRFTDDRIENADVLKMDVECIYMKDGLRYAEIVPSPYPSDTNPIPSLPTVSTMVGGIDTL